MHNRFIGSENLTNGTTIMELHFSHKLSPSISGSPFKNFNFVLEDAQNFRNIFFIEHLGEIIAVCSFVDSSFRYPNKIGIAAVEVLPNFRGKGLSKILLSQLFNYANLRQKEIYPGHFEPLGEQRIKKYFDNPNLLDNYRLSLEFIVEN